MTALFWHSRGRAGPCSQGAADWGRPIPGQFLQTLTQPIESNVDFAWDLLMGHLVVVPYIERDCPVCADFLPWDDPEISPHRIGCVHADHDGPCP